MSKVRIVVSLVNVSENKNTIVTGDVREEREGRKKNSSVMMLFESGNHVNVNASFYNAPSDVVRPIDAYVVTECGGECAQAARCAVEAVYSVYQQVHPRKISTRQVVAFDLGGRVVSPITGNSGGLAFAVSAAKHIFSYDPGPVAATGHVVSSHGGGPVGGVKGVEAKVRRAMQKLPSGGVIIYPKENEKEVSDDLRREVAGAGLQFYSVSSVQEMLEMLFAVKIDSGHRNMFKMSMLWLLLGVSLVIGGVFSYVKWGADQSTSVSPVAGVPEEAPSEKEISSSTNSSTVATGNRVPKTKTIPALIETGNTVPKTKTNPALVKAGNTVPKTKTNPALVKAGNTVPKTKTNPPLVETGNTVLKTNKNPELVEPENLQLAEEDEEQENPPERVPSEGKEAAEQQQFLNKGFD
jgi:hypothetical protein